MSPDAERRQPDARLLEVAAALADGCPVDWHTPDDVEPGTSGVLNRLQSIERLSEAFRRTSAAGESPAVQPPRRAAPPFTWGHLEGLELVGAGGFGDVYRAWDPVLDRDVALKLFRSDLSSTPAPDVQLEEARRLARIRHPNVLTVHGAAVHDGRPGLWSDLIQGETLEHLSSNRGPFGGSEAIAIGIDLCRALAALHAEGILHGDLKASNVMREDGGRVVLMDLGAGRHVNALGGAIYGTPSSAAPEVLGGNPPTTLSDLYSLGALLFRMLTGVHRGDDVAPGRAGEGRSLRDLRPDISSALAAVIERALSIEPARRFPSAGAIAEALQHALDEERRPLAPATGRSPRGLRRWRLASLAAIATIGAAVIVVKTGGLGWRTTAAGRPLGVSHLRPFATSVGSIPQAAFSPDGRRIAFISDESGSPQVWVQDVSGGTPRRLTDTKVYVNQPAWTPDGARILFTVWGTIQAVSPDGGAPVTILERAWNPNVGRFGRLVFERGEEIWTADHDGSNARKVTGVPERAMRVGERLPVFSPDESQIAFVHAVDRPWGDVWMIPAAGGTARQLTSAANGSGRPAWSADGRTIIFASRAAATLTLSQVNVHRALDEGPQQPRRLVEGDGENTAPAVSADGRSLLFTVTRNRFSISMLDPNRGTERSLRDSLAHLMSPVISNDGRRVAFFGWGREGHMHVYTMDVNGGNLVQVTSPESGDGQSTFPLWSADGRELFFYRDTSEPSWRRVPATGGPSTEVKAGWTASERNMVRLDMTGRQAVYTWQERDLARVTRVLDLETGAEREFHRLLRYPSFAADGRSILGVDAAPNPAAPLGPLVACPLNPAPCRQLAPLATHSRSSADGRIVYFQRPLQSRHAFELWAVRIDGSDSRKLQTFTTETPFVPAFDVAPSGGIVVARFHQGAHELWLADLTK